MGLPQSARVFFGLDGHRAPDNSIGLNDVDVGAICRYRLSAQLSRKVLCAGVVVALEHLQTLVAGDCCKFDHIRQLFSHQGDGSVT